ncbi:unnamed protein product [Cladocopium goreaui]|uniref:Ubiquitin-like domain-containing protein n=1 Tax=Cladocopium goreaui TaxID=2562237 RepID=A0A9P1CDE7_9DINO|nr:unnamed protein product [Cladocopium goreaui]
MSCLHVSVLALSGKQLVCADVAKDTLVEDLQFQVEQATGVDKAAQRLLYQGEILPPTAALDCLGADPACKDRVVTLVVTNPTVEYQVMQGVIFKSKGAQPSSSKIVKLEKAVGDLVKTTGRTWLGPAGGHWIELDPVFHKAGWLLIEGPGFGKVGPLLEEVLPNEPEAIVMRFSSPYNDDEIHQICIKPSWTIGQVKQWMCIRLPCLRREKIVIVKRRCKGRAARFTPSSFLLDDRVRVEETDFRDGEELPYIYMGDLDDAEPWDF